MEYIWSHDAFTKMSLHLARFLDNPIFGILFGDISSDSIKIVDSIPLFHNRILAPMLEIALLFVFYC